MTIDERALRAATDAVRDAEMRTSEARELARAAIEAYEVAKPDPWRPIAEIMKAVNWYVIFNDLAYLKYMKYVSRDDKEYWDYVIENYPRAQFMVVHFGEQS